MPSEPAACRESSFQPEGEERGVDKRGEMTQVGDHGLQGVEKRGDMTQVGDHGLQGVDKRGGHESGRGSWFAGN